LTSFSSCLLVPQYFYDARKFQKLEKTQKSKTKTHKYDFMNNYEVDKKNPECITAVKNGQSIKKATIQDLLKKMKNPGTHLNERY